VLDETSPIEEEDEREITQMKNLKKTSTKPDRKRKKRRRTWKKKTHLRRSGRSRPRQ
jgi:hypothetical protein